MESKQNINCIVLFSVMFTLFSMTIAGCDDYDMSKLGRYEGLDVETEKRIISDYQKQNSSLKLKDVWIGAYHGTYNGVVFVEIEVKMLGPFFTISPYKDICIDGITLLHWRTYIMTRYSTAKGTGRTARIWYKSRFYDEVYEAYQLCPITLDDLKTVASNHYGGWVECTHETH